MEIGEKIKSTNDTNLNFPVWIPIAVFLVTTVIFFWNIIVGNAFFWEDFIEYVFPVQSFAARESANANLPFWNPFTFGGIPFLADIQVGFFYPLNRIFTLFVGADGNVPLSIMQNVTILHFFIAQLSMFFLMRGLKVSSLGSMLSTVSYAFSFSLALHIIHPMIIIHLSWFPLVIFFLHKALNGQRIFYGIIAGLIFAMSIMSGHPQMLLYEALFLGIFAVWSLVYDVTKKTITSPKAIAKYVIAGALPFVIAACIFQVQYLPTTELAENSIRSEMTYDKAAEGSLDIKQIFTIVVPKMFGSDQGDRLNPYLFELPTTDANGKHVVLLYTYFYWEMSFYFGLAALMLGLYGFIALPKNKMTMFLIIIAAFGFLYALGSHGIFFNLFYNLPFFGSFRFPARIMFFVVTAFTMAAGFGFDRLIQSERKRSELSKLFIVTGIVTFMILLVLSGMFTHENYYKYVSEFASSAFVFALILFALLMLLYLKKMPVVVGSLIVLVAFLDLMITNAGFHESPVDLSQKYKLPQETYTMFKPRYPNDIFRVSMRIREYDICALQRNEGMMSGIMLVEGYNSLLLSRYDLPFATREEKNSLWNTKYEITAGTMLVNDAPVDTIFFRNREKEIVPRAWLVGEMEQVNSDKIADYMLNTAVNYMGTVIVEDKISADLPGANKFDYNYSVEFIEYKNNSITLKTSSKDNAMLVLSEVYYPAWKAYIDGVPAEIYRANYNFRTIPVKAGEHVIEMKYESAAYASGALITIITLILSALGLIFFRKY